MGPLFIIILVALVIFVGPAIMIWAVNVLLAAIGIATIALGFKTWFAMLIIMIFLGGSASKS